MDMSPEEMEQKEQMVIFSPAPLLIRDLPMLPSSLTGAKGRLIDPAFEYHMR
jgi:hypothetical protein